MQKVTLNIGGEAREIELKPYTRKIDREYFTIMSKGLNIGELASGDNATKMNSVENLQQARDYLVTSLTGLTTEEVDEMDVRDYEKVLKIAEELKAPLKGKN